MSEYSECCTTLVTESKPRKQFPTRIRVSSCLIYSEKGLNDDNNNNKRERERERVKINLQKAIERYLQIQSFDSYCSCPD
jgi:hypothetical protein